jgi:hypothetical protein
VEGAKGDRKRHKQRLQEVEPMANDDNGNGNGKQAGKPGVLHVMAAASSGKC